MRDKAGKTGGDCSRDPRGNFQFNDLPEGLAKLRRAVKLMVLVYYHKGDGLKSAKVSSAWNRVQDRQCNLPVALSQLRGHFILPATACVMRYAYC